MSDERYQQRQQRVKEKVDARVAQAQDERGIIIVFTGNGKGKTTAAFGTATRAVGHLIPRPAVKSGNMPNECWQILHWIWFCSMN